MLKHNVIKEHCVTIDQQLLYNVTIVLTELSDRITNLEEQVNKPRASVPKPRPAKKTTKKPVSKTAKKK